MVGGTRRVADRETFDLCLLLAPRLSRPAARPATKASAKLRAVRCSDAAEAEVCQWATGDTCMTDVATCPQSWWCHALSSICWQVLVTFGSDVLLKTDVRGVHVTVVAPGAERVVCVLSCGDRFLRFPEVMYR